MGLAPHPSVSTSLQVRLNLQLLMAHATCASSCSCKNEALISTIKTLQHTDLNPTARSGSKNTFTTSEYACFLCEKQYSQYLKTSEKNQSDLPIECTLYYPEATLCIYCTSKYYPYSYCIDIFFNRCSLCQTVCDFGDSFCSLVRSSLCV